MLSCENICELNVITCSRCENVKNQVNSLSLILHSRPTAIWLECVTMFSRCTQRPKKEGLRSLSSNTDKYRCMCLLNFLSHYRNCKQTQHHATASWLRLCMQSHLYFDFMVFNEFLSSCTTKFPSVHVIEWRFAEYILHSQSAFVPPTNTHTHPSAYMLHTVYPYAKISPAHGVVDAKATEQINCIIRMNLRRTNERTEQ